MKEFLSRWRMARSQWRSGADFKIPWCCRLHFCIGSLFFPHGGQGERRGLIVQLGASRVYKGEDRVYIPCRFHMRGPYFYRNPHNTPQHPAAWRTPTST